MPFHDRYRLYWAAAGIAFWACLIITPLVRRLAVRLVLVDRPDQHRKLHRNAVPLGGGAAVLVAFLVAVAAVFTLSRSQQAVLAEDTRFFAALLIAALVICLVGLSDDRHHLRGRQKLAGQIAA
ncbi:MAG TPA: hypothetical protein EYP14_18530, partial [Planctomycetaceae bacterium]|nr:hypothetical protein [Planctomycetaceae bacterium]